MTTVNNIDAGGGDGVLHERITTLQSDHNELKASIERKFDHVSASIAAIASDIKERAKFNWQPVSILLSFVTAVGALVYWPIKENLSALSDGQKAMAERVVTEKEFSTFIGVVKERRDDQQRVAEARFGRLESDVDKLQGAVVPRGELEANWSSQRARDSEFQRQLDEQRGRVEGIYSPKDALAAMQRRIEDLESRQAGRR